MKSLKFLFSITFLVIFLFVFSENTFENKIKENEKKLNKIKKELKVIKSKKDSIRKQKTKTLLVLNSMDEEIYLTDLLIKQLERKDSLLNLKIKKLNEDIDTLSIELEKRKEILRKRIRDIYKKGKVHTFEVVFSSSSFSDLTQKVRYLRTVARQDKKLFDRVKREQQMLAMRIEDFNNTKEQLELVKNEAEKEKQTLITEKQNKKNFLKELASEQKKQKKLEDELKKSEQSLQYLINKLQVAHRKVERKRDVAKGKHYFDTHKRKVMHPAKGKIISKFGTVRHPKYKTKTLNNGIDIKVKIGDPVYAVYDGDVIYADKFLGYGNVIMLDHGNGYYTLYAHLSEIDVILNQPVLMGEIIGKCGDTGSLSGPVLHFEIRKDGKPLNPLNYLK